MMTLNAHLSECLLLTYRTAADSVRDLLPADLEPMTHGSHAFWSVAVSRILHLRHAGMPEWLGIECRHVAYRLLVQPPAGSAASGPLMYQINAVADMPLVRRLGRRLAGVQLDPADIELTHNDQVILLKLRDVADHAGDARLCAGLRVVPLPPETSQFPSLEAARAVLPVMAPSLLRSADGRPDRLMRLRPLAGEFAESQVHVFDARWGALERLGQRRAQLELAVRLAPTEVAWNVSPLVASTAADVEATSRTCETAASASAPKANAALRPLPAAARAVHAH